MNNEITIFFTADEAYAPFLATAIASAVENSSPARRYRAVILHQGISDDTLSRITALARDNFKIEPIEMTHSFDGLDDRMSNRLRCDYFTLTIYFRLFIPEMFPELDRAVYIDSDVVLTDDIAKLYDTDIGDCLIGACQDLSIADVPPLVEYTENAIGMARGEYINSGVLLMDLKALRDCRLGARFLEILNTYHLDTVAPDQDYLNAMCYGRIFYLDGAWDAMPNDSKEPLESPSLIHYNLFSKPWCRDGVQYADVFWSYADKSGFGEEIRAYRAGYTADKIRADDECLELLIKRAVEITHSETTFKTLYEKGVKIRL